MKNIKICFTLLLLVLLGVACFEDDSNYEYGTSEIINYSIDMDVKTAGYAWGTPIVVKPLKFNKGPYADMETIDSTKFRWEYYSADFAEDPTVPICTTFTFQRELWKEGAVLSTSYSMLVRAIDSLGNIYDGSFSVKYNGYAYPTSNRWVLLAENSAGESVVHLVQGTDTSNFKVYNDVAKMGTGPRNIYYASNWVVFGVEEESSGMTYMHPYTYALYRTPGQLFESGSVPAGEKLKMETSVNGCIGLAWCQSGKVYYKIFEAKAKHSSTKYPDKTLKHEDGTDVDCGFILTRDQNAYSRTDLVIYDKTKKGLYYVCGKDLKNAGKVVPILAPANNVDCPAPNDLSGYEVLYAENNGYAGGNYYLILRKDGKVYYYDVAFAIANYYSAKVARSTALKFYEIEGTHSDFPEDVNLYDFDQNPKYLYFVPKSNKKSIHYYDMATNKVGVYMEFDGGEDITKLAFRFDNQMQSLHKWNMGVGKGNKFYLLNTAAAYMQPTVAFEDKIVGEFEFDSKIVGIAFK